MRRSPILGAAAVVTAGLLVLTAPAVGTTAPSRGPAPGHFTAAERLGLQQVPKHVAGASSAKSALSARGHGTNPFIGLLADPSKADVAYWRAVLKSGGKKRAAAAAKKTKTAAPPLLVDEQEPDQIRGGNDTPATAERIRQFGSAAGKRPAARILGTLAVGPAPLSFDSPAEDNGAIPLAGDIGPTRPGSRATTTGTVGDGPHGSAGDGAGDFDFYKLTAAEAGQRFEVDIDAFETSGLDSVVVLWDAAGNPIALNDDDGQTFDSRLTFTLPTAGDYFVSVAGFGPSPMPNDPFNSGSGDGVGSEGAYRVTFGLDSQDVDVYSVDLRAGDVLGGSVTGAGTQLAVYDPSSRARIVSQQDASFLYPMSSPLPGGGKAVFAHVADVAGRHAIAVTGGSGNYDITLEVYRPGAESLGKTAMQTVFLDFDGARVNTGVFGGSGVSQLSPFRSFLGRWGLAASQEGAVADRIVRTVTENLQRDFGAKGVAVRVLDSRHHADPFGKPNVSRVIVGGTIAESGVPTIGIAQSIDPGNFGTEETALVLLDVMSDPASDYEDPNPSLNAYLTPQSDRVGFVGQAVGNVVSHEAGHLLGSFHVDQFDTVLNLMDQGGNFPLLFGVGPDGVGGTADDWDVDFGEDAYNPSEGYTGVEDTAANTKWGLSPRR
ncbi:MAG: hypothetical protein QOC93_4230 [Actinomycetota bacterium]|nr:hypothetical protein [Actinomycetota bacterium]